MTSNSRSWYQYAYKGRVYAACFDLGVTVSATTWEQLDQEKEVAVPRVNIIYSRHELLPGLSAERWGLAFHG